MDLQKIVIETLDKTLEKHNVFIEYLYDSRTRFDELHDSAKVLKNVKFIQVENLFDKGELDGWTTPRLRLYVRFPNEPVSYDVHNIFSDNALAVDHERRIKIFALQVDLTQSVKDAVKKVFNVKPNEVYALNGDYLFSRANNQNQFANFIALIETKEQDDNEFDKRRFISMLENVLVANTTDLFRGSDFRLRDWFSKGLDTKVGLKHVPLVNVPLDTLDFNHVKDEHKDLIFVGRHNEYYGAFKVDVPTSTCAFTGYRLTHLREFFNEMNREMFEDTDGTRQPTYFSNWAKDNKLFHTCNYCGRVGLTGEKTRCETCNRFLKHLKVDDLKIIKDYYHVEEYNHTEGLEFFNDDLSTTHTSKQGQLYLGVELEVDNVNDYCFDDLDDEERENEIYERDRRANVVLQVLTRGKNRGVNAKNDGSLNAGFEIVMQPATLKAHENVFDYERAFETTKRAGYNSHDTSTCGLHVHINRDFFGTTRDAQLYNGAKMVYLLEKNWDDFVRFSRRTGDTLRRWANKQKARDDFERDDNGTKDAGKLTSNFYAHYHGNKYVALNTGHTHTFELRIFRGTLNYRTFMATLQLVDNFARLVKTLNINQLQSITFDDIVNFRKHEHLTKYWNDRKGQDIIEQRDDDDTTDDNGGQ